MLANTKFLRPGPDQHKLEQFECALRLLNTEHLEDIIQERIQCDLCSNLRCLTPNIDPSVVKVQLSRKLDFSLKNKNEEEERSKKRIYCDFKADFVSLAKIKSGESKT